MGACASKEAHTDLPATVAGGQQTIPVPGQVFSPQEGSMASTNDEQTLNLRVNDESGAMSLGRTGSGRIVLQVQNVHSPHIAEVDATLESGIDGKEYQALKLLEKMGLELQFSPGDPFIGQLVLNVVEVADLQGAVTKPYVVVCGEGDKSQPKAPHKVEGGGSTLLFDDAKFVFFVLFSNSSFQISLKARRGAGKVLIGKATLDVSHLKQGFERGELDLLNDKGAKVGTAKVDVDYRWLRGTRDDGTYTVVNRVVVGKVTRGMRKTLHVGKAAIELISQGDDKVPLPDAEAAVGEVEDGGSAEQGVLEAMACQAELVLPEGDAASQLQCSLEGAAELESSATSRMVQALLVEALGPKEGESGEVGALKQAMLVVMVPLLERLEGLEARVHMLTHALQQHQQRETAPVAPVAAAAVLPLGCAPASAGAGADNGKGASVAPEVAGPTLPAQVNPFVSGQFEYGMGRPASRRTVFMFLRKAHLAGSSVMLPEFLGTHKTKWAGKLGPVPLPPTICKTPGHYEVIGMLPDDYSSAKGSLFILQPGTKAVVFDMDGTLTVGDGQVVTQFGLDALGASTALNEVLSHKFDLRARRHALHMVRAWAAKGYQPVYLSGRQGSYYNLTLAWLIKHRFPPGPIHLTRSHMPTLPVYFSVGMFKVKYLEMLKEKGIQLYAAYGNTTTDIKAYEAAGVPKERTFIVGPHGGKAGSVKVDNLTDHMHTVLAQPDADVPIPYTELIMSERPGYYRKKKVQDASGAMRELSTITSMGGLGDIEESIAESGFDDLSEDSDGEGMPAIAEAEGA